MQLPVYRPVHSVVHTHSSSARVTEDSLCSARGGGGETCWARSAAFPLARMDGVASAVQEASDQQEQEWGMMMDPAEIDVIAAFLRPSTVMLEWCVLS